MFNNQVGSSTVFEYSTEKVAHYLQGNLSKVNGCSGVKISVGSWDRFSQKFVPFICILNGASLEGSGKNDENDENGVSQSGLSDYEMFRQLYPHEEDNDSGSGYVRLKDSVFKYIFRFTFNNKAALERDPNSYIDLIHNVEFKQALNIKREDAFKLNKVFKGPREIKDDRGKSAVVFLNPVYVLRDMARDDMGIKEDEMKKYNVAIIGMKKNGNYSYSYLLSVEEGTLFYGQKVERGQSEFDRAANKLFMGQRMN